MRIVFCGTPSSAVPSLRALAAEREWELATVLSQPDRPAGRGRRAIASPVKRAALELGIPVLTPEKLKEVREELKSLRPDVIAVVAYGRIFRRWLLELPPLSCVNVHFSLLPRHRGVAPVQWAILAGEKRTGVTTMRMERGVDTGPVFLEEATEIGARETAGELTDRLAQMGGPLLVRTLRGLASGTLQPMPQVDADATYAPRLEKEDGRIDWTWPAEEISRRVRGLSPWPGAFTRFRGKMLKIHAANAAPGEADAGRLLEAGGLVAVGTGAGLLELEEVQLEGKARMKGETWARGVRPRDGERLGAD